MSTDTSFTHSSYGLIAISRCTGNPGSFFGSPLESHESYITIRIGKGEWIREGGYDRFFGSMRGEYIEVRMTASQYAELLTTMNVGLGVPCTIMCRDGQQIEKPPRVQTEAEVSRKHFHTNAQRIGDLFGALHAKVAVILAKPSLVKADRLAILSLVTEAVRHFDSNADYHLTLFEEACDRVVTAAKAEADSFLTHTMMAKGLEAMRAAKPALPPSDGPTRPELLK